MSVLEVENLSISFTADASALQSNNHQVISNLTMALEAGEILAVVGASGSGKSLLAHAILGILPSHANIGGTIKYEGKALSNAEQAALRGKEMALVPQSVNFLDPLMRVGKQVRTSVKEGDRATIQREVFERYRLSEEVDHMFPFQLSGGMARRVLLSTAMVSEAKIIIADEPTPGLDQVVSKEALNHFRQFADDGCAVMLITHDIESALTIADKIAVFYAGTIVEVTPAEHFAGSGEALRHPYSKALWRALPQNDFIPVPGLQPHPSELPSGCLFEPRCDKATSECGTSQPIMRNLRNGMVRCIHAT